MVEIGVTHPFLTIHGSNLTISWLHLTISWSHLTTSGMSTGVFFGSSGLTGLCLPTMQPWGSSKDRTLTKHQEETGSTHRRVEEVREVRASLLTARPTLQAHTHRRVHIHNFFFIGGIY